MRGKINEPAHVAHTAACLAGVLGTEPDVDVSYFLTALDRKSDSAIAAIASCTNTANPYQMIAAGLLARNAVAKGLRDSGDFNAAELRLIDRDNALGLFPRLKA